MVVITVTKLLYCMSVIVCVLSSFPSGFLFKIWATRRVPYKVDLSLDSSINESVYEAFDVIQAHDCITFEEKTSFDIDYLNIIPGENCETKVGRAGGEQNLRLSRNCGTNGVLKAGDVLHELMHTLGFYHEHQRRDREQYIQYYRSNVEIGQWGNFHKKRFLWNKTYEYEYDYDSITHYGEYAFSMNREKTIETLDPSKSNVIGQRNHLSVLDVKKIKMYYGCDEEPVINNCPSLPNEMSNGYYYTVQGQDSEVGHMVKYNCDSDYMLVGPTYRVCQLDGQWLAYEPMCLTPQHYCNFDNDSWCGWTRSGQGSLRRQCKGTYYEGTGPDNDYTTMSSKGFYVLVDTLYSPTENDQAILTSPTFTLYGHMCFRFAYSMYGKDINNLYIYYLKDEQQHSIMNKTGDQGYGWKVNHFEFPPDVGSINIKIQFTVGNGARGDAAIDDLLLVDCSQL